MLAKMFTKVSCAGQMISDIANWIIPRGECVMPRSYCPLLLPVSIILFLLFFSPDCRAQSDSPEGHIISTITVTGCRICPDIVLNKIPIKVGQPWSAKLESDAINELNKMGIFKEVAISSQYDSSVDGVVVNINAHDGWFLLPLPLIAGGSGGGGMSLMLISGNLFKQGENIMLGGGNINGASSGMLGVMLDGWSINASGGSSKQTEGVYADGAYSLNNNSSTSNASPVVNSYTRKSATSSFELRREIAENNTIGLSFSQAQYDFSGSATVPDAHGMHNALGVSYEYRHDTQEGVSSQPMGFGVMFGMGLSGLDEMLKPLPATEREETFGLKLVRAGEFIGSDYDYTLFCANLRETWEFTDRDRFSVSLQGLKGWDLPRTQLISNTNNQLLYGTYKRDWRGDKAISSVASYTYYLRRTKRGVLAAEPFAEIASVWDGDSPQTQSGAGLSFIYKFWRFPMPLGLTVTRSFHDNDWGVSAMAGFGFGH